MSDKRICIIFNPTARGEKAKRFQKWLAGVAAQCVLKPTTGPGTAPQLAAHAVNEGFETIVAAGGDGTVNEVLNGIGLADGFARARLAILPLGTINVFAKEIGLSARLDKSWQTILAGNESNVDLPSAEFTADGKRVTRYFAQLAGAGLDARAIELVDWKLKKATGAFEYISAGVRALQQKLHPIHVTAEGTTASGELVLIGNGQFYGGKLRIFPLADLRDGKLDVCVFPKVDWQAMARCGWGLLTNQMLEHSGAQHFSAKDLTLSCDEKAALQLDGDNVGHLPATMRVFPKRLRVVVP